ncbi:MAG: thiamine phosphate synthase [Propionibacteriaceae bacterium]
MTALMGLKMRLKLARLFVVCDALADRDKFGSFVTDVFAGGVDMLQVRVGDCPEKILLERLQDARNIAFSCGGIVVVHESVKVGAAHEADAFHLRDRDKSLKGRQGLHQWGLLGRTAHTAKEVRAGLEDELLDYLWVGPVMEDAGGIDLLKETVLKATPSLDTSKPWFACGGIDLENLDEVIAAGARRIAVSRAVCKADNPREVVAQMKQQLRDAWREDSAMEAYALAVLGAGSGSKFQGFPK